MGMACKVKRLGRLVVAGFGLAAAASGRELGGPPQRSGAAAETGGIGALRRRFDRGFKGISACS